LTGTLLYEPETAMLISSDLRISDARPPGGSRRIRLLTLRLLPSLCASALLLLPALGAAEFRAGAAAVNVTPNLGTAVNGGVGPGRALHVHDDLFAKALVLEDGPTRLAWVVVDTCLVDREVFDAAKRLVVQHTGIPASHQMMSATHTHSAGAVTGAHLCEPDPTYRAWLPDRLADAVRVAVNRLAPAQIGWASGSVPQHVFCRRLLIRPGMTYTNQLGFTGERAKMNWDSPHPADGEPSAPVDPELFVVSVQTAAGKPLAILANYSLHYVGDVGPGHISADYFGVFADRLQQLLGADRQDPPFVALLSNGTSGDVNNVNPRERRAPQPAYTQIRRVAFDVADEALRVLEGLRHRRDVPLSATTTEVRVITRRPTPAEVEQARQRVDGRSVAQLSGWQDNYARDTLLLADYPETLPVPLQLFRVGELAVAAWPGEIFASTGLELKRRSPVQPLFNLGLANGWYGYIPPPEQHALGAYETWRARTAPLEVDATVKLLDAFLELLAGPR
jgi:hypothetical protein